MDHDRKILVMGDHRSLPLVRPVFRRRYDAGGDACPLDSSLHLLDFHSSQRSCALESVWVLDTETTDRLQHLDVTVSDLSNNPGASVTEIFGWAQTWFHLNGLHASKG